MKNKINLFETIGSVILLIMLILSKHASNLIVTTILVTVCIIIFGYEIYKTINTSDYRYKWISVINDLVLIILLTISFCFYIDIITLEPVKGKNAEGIFRLILTLSIILNLLLRTSKLRIKK